MITSVLVAIALGLDPDRSTPEFDLLGVPVFPSVVGGMGSIYSNGSTYHLYSGKTYDHSSELRKFYSRRMTRVKVIRDANEMYLHSEPISRILVMVGFGKDGKHVRISCYPNDSLGIETLVSITSYSISKSKRIQTRLVNRTSQ